jgi:hypothetical protein
MGNTNGSSSNEDKIIDNSYFIGDDRNEVIKVLFCTDDSLDSGYILTKKELLNDKKVISYYLLNLIIKFNSFSFFFHSFNRSFFLSYFY